MHQGVGRLKSRVSEHTREYVSILNRFDEPLKRDGKRGKPLVTFCHLNRQLLTSEKPLC